MIDNIVYKGDKPILRLNLRLITQQGLTQEEVDNLKELHLQRESIEARMKRSKKPETIRGLFAEWTEAQYQLQDGWKFDRDANWHPSHQLPHCSCPKLDGDERVGVPYKVFDQNCVIHGSLYD